MSYNWTPASTPQGRERLKELVQNGNGVILSTWPMSLYALTLDEGQYSVLGFGSFGTLDEMIDNLKSPQFLDPEPPQPKIDGDAPEGYHVVTFAKDQHPDENGLMTCPFCGGKAEYSHDKHVNHQWIVCCSRCGAESSPNGFVFTRDEAIEEWNKRA